MPNLITFINAVASSKWKQSTYFLPVWSLSILSPCPCFQHPLSHLTGTRPAVSLKAFATCSSATFLSFWYLFFSLAWTTDHPLRAELSSLGFSHITFTHTPAFLLVTAMLLLLLPLIYQFWSMPSLGFWKLLSSLPALSPKVKMQWL